MGRHLCNGTFARARTHTYVFFRLVFVGFSRHGCALRIVALQQELLLLLYSVCHYSSISRASAFNCSIFKPMLLRIASLSLSSFSPHRRNKSSYLSTHSLVASFARFASSSKYVVPRLSNADSISSRASAKSAFMSRSSVARSSVEMKRRSERRGPVPKLVPRWRRRERRMRARNMRHAGARAEWCSSVGAGKTRTPLFCAEKKRAQKVSTF